MKKISVIDKIKNAFGNKAQEKTRLELVTQRNNGFYAWNGKLYDSDLVRACINPKVKAIGKLVGKHIRETVDCEQVKKIEVNPDPRIRFLLEAPNPLMSGQKLQEKLAAQLCLNNNAFALIMRDETGVPIEIYPLPANSVEANYQKAGELYLTFAFENGKRFAFPYRDIIHLRQNFYENDIFGSSIAPVLTPLMEVVNTIDQGIVNAVKNSAVIQWLLKLTTSQRQEDVKKYAENFANTFLDTRANKVGVAATDAKAEAIQIKPTNYVPNAAQQDRTYDRIKALFNTNDKIIHSDYSEDEWTAYYEAEIEPAAIDMKNQYTYKVFSRRAIGHGNTIIFEAVNLATASMKTKLALQAMVDRGALTPNEWRAAFNYAPLPGGDKPVRRLDTAPVTEEVINIED